jgi:hypothetical protein
MSYPYITFPDDVPSLLEKLGPDTAPLWGQMTAQHMVEHLVLLTKFSNGSLEAKTYTDPDIWLQRKLWLMSDEPFARNIKIGPQEGQEGPGPLRWGSLDEARDKLLTEMERYTAFWADDPAVQPPHPAFGPLDRDEWQQFHRKHFTHHFVQFGLVEGN